VAASSLARFPEGFRLESLCAEHPRNHFESGQSAVDSWLQKNALQNQRKRLSVTRVLLSGDGRVAGYYTTAMGQADFSQLPQELVRKLPRRALPVAVLAWLGIDRQFQGRGLGARLLAHALSECHRAGEAFAFVAVILDCVDESAKQFYLRWDFREVPGRPMRLFLSADALDVMMTDEDR
jgi:GNAT superfamily N-acetyltransferase